MCPAEDQRVRAWRLAMDLLARREHSRRELARKLKNRELPVAIVDQVLDELTEHGLLDNERFAEAFVRNRSARGKGPRKILAELTERGIESSLAQQALAAAEMDWTALAVAALEKRFGRAPVEDLKDRARRMRFLAQRGFSQEQAGAALTLLRRDTEPVAGEEI